MTASTEHQAKSTLPIDALPLESGLTVMLDAQLAAINSIQKVIPQLAEAAKTVSNCLEAGGRLIYVGAGSSGLMALADGLELPGTFGIDPTQIKIFLAEGLKTVSNFSAASEDDADRGSCEILALRPTNKDCMIAVSASGSTPYTIGALRAVSSTGAKSISITCNADCPLQNEADIAVTLDTPPEILSDSTRLGAGSAQKVALNLISTCAGVLMGHVHDGLMVNLRPENAKLNIRANEIIMTITGCNAQTASDNLNRAHGSTKAAVLLSKGAASLAVATEYLIQSNYRLCPALDNLNASQL